MIAFYRIKPQSVYALPSGDVAVCIDWEQKTVEWPIGEVQGWQCRRVDISHASLSTDAAIEKLLRDRIALNDEFALINAYQASVNGIAKDEEKEQEYLDFLQWRENMKAQVKDIVPEFLSAHPYVYEEEQLSNPNE